MTYFFKPTERISRHDNLTIPPGDLWEYRLVSRDRVYDVDKPSDICYVRTLCYYEKNNCKQLSLFDRY